MPNPEAADWDYFWSREESRRFHQVSWSKRRMMRVLYPYCIPNRKALDAGCGSGFFSAFFCDRGMETVSLDYSAGALAAAQRATSGRSRIVKADLLNDPLGDAIPETFDVIFSDGLLEHFPAAGQDKIMQQLRGRLSPDGVLVTFVPNRWSPWELIRPFFMPGIEEKPFTLRGLMELNRRNGLEVIERGGVNTLPFFLSPDRLLASRFGMLLYTTAKKRGV